MEENPRIKILQQLLNDKLRRGCSFDEVYPISHELDELIAEELKNKKKRPSQ